MLAFLNKLRSFKHRILNQHPVYAREPWKDPSQFERIVRDFHGLYYDSFRHGKTWADTWFLGTKVEKCPLDLWLYQELLFKLKPDLIVETGTRFGGSAYFIASVCELIGKGEVITIDIDDSIKRPTHPRITYVTGSSIDKNVVDVITAKVAGKASVMVMLDSDHACEHVYAELSTYSKFVTKDSFLIVEDSNVNGNPVLSNFGPGPMEAIAKFLQGNKHFIPDPIEKKFLLSFSPNGFLRRVD